MTWQSVLRFISSMISMLMGKFRSANSQSGCTSVVKWRGMFIRGLTVNWDQRVLKLFGGNLEKLVCR